MAIARKLKDLAADAVSVPTTQELYERKCSDLDEAKRKLDAIIARQLQAEKNPQSQRRDIDPIVAAKHDAEAKVARLSREAGLIKQQIIDARPKTPPVTWQQSFIDAAAFDPYARIERGSDEQIAAAQADLDALNREFHLTQPTGAAREAWTAKKNAARTRLEALRGAPYPQHRPWGTKEQLTAARVAEGFKQ